MSTQAGSEPTTAQWQAMEAMADGAWHSIREPVLDALDEHDFDGLWDGPWSEVAHGEMRLTPAGLSLLAERCEGVPVLP